MKKNFSKIKNNSKGATLIELLIAVIIFSLVMMAVISILISAINANKRIIAKQENIDNARYSMEFMVKELRMAKSIDTFYKNGVFPISPQVERIKFNNSIAETVTYSLIGGKITRKVGAGTDQPISSESINVTALNFSINNWDLTQGSGTAPLITIFMEMKGRTGIAASETVSLQSSVSPRIY